MIIALETASYGKTSVALLDGCKVIDSVEITEKRQVAARLIPTIRSLLESNSVSESDIKIIAVDCGPGSFTGIRIGIAAAKGLADGWQSKIVGVSVFELFPKPKSENINQIIFLDAKAGGNLYYELRKTDGEIFRGAVNKKNIVSELLSKSDKGIVSGEIDRNLLENTNWDFFDKKLEINAAEIGKIAFEKKEAPAEAIYLNTLY